MAVITTHFPVREQSRSGGGQTSPDVVAEYIGQYPAGLMSGIAPFATPFIEVKREKAIFHKRTKKAAPLEGTALGLS
ncbi:MAG: hypothetical protein AAGH99_04290 [Planctomycetota bacterium]